MRLLIPAIGVTSAMRAILPIREEIAAREDAQAASTTSAQPVPVTATPYHQGKFVDLTV